MCARLSWQGTGHCSDSHYSDKVRVDQGSCLVRFGRLIGTVLIC